MKGEALLRNTTEPLDLTSNALISAPYASQILQCAKQFLGCTHRLVKEYMEIVLTPANYKA